jgi:hypothetical protein
MLHVDGKKQCAHAPILTPRKITQAALNLSAPTAISLNYPEKGKFTSQKGKFTSQKRKFTSKKGKFTSVSSSSFEIIEQSR